MPRWPSARSKRSTWPPSPAGRHTAATGTTAGSAGPDGAMDTGLATAMDLVTAMGQATATGTAMDADLVTAMGLATATGQATATGTGTSGRDR
jgi:hypothetical protein